MSTFNKCTCFPPVPPPLPHYPMYFSFQYHIFHLCTSTWVFFISSISFLIMVTFFIALTRVIRFLIVVLIFLSIYSIIAVIPQSISINWLFSLLWVIFSCFSACLVICDQMLGSVWVLTIKFLNLLQRCC